MIKWCYLGIISFNDSNRSGQILLWGFFLFRCQTKRAGKNILGQNFLRFSLAKWNQKTHHAKTLNEPKYFIPPKLNVLCYDYSFFFFNWMTLWMNKLQNFICKLLECKDFPCSKIYSCTLLSAKNLCEFNLNLFIVSIFLSNSLLVENIPQHFSSYYWTDSWIFFLPYQWDFFLLLLQVFFWLCFFWWRTFQFFSLMI